jgi:outer membrane receptor for ferrienterochelin and colicin
MIKALPFFLIIITGSPVLAEIEEVIVTAAKREQSLQDVPIAVSVVDGEIIERSGMIDLFDLSLSVPSMKMNQLQRVCRVVSGSADSLMDQIIRELSPRLAPS